VLLDKQAFNALEMELKTARGTRWISIAGDPIIDTAGRFEGFRGVGSDITEIRQTQERLTHLANVDVLSGLPNRGRVRQLLGESLRHATTGNVPCAIMFLDLDGFKPVNDQFGHDVGDELLRVVAQRLRTSMRSDDAIARLGGDEFVVVAERLSTETQAEELGLKLLEAFRAPFALKEHTCSVRATIGYALAPTDADDAVALLKAADAAMYAGKQAGKDRLVRLSAIRLKP
jgi:diguanylate cyclase (GGDEF)-like protein